MCVCWYNWEEMGLMDFIDEEFDTFEESRLPSLLMAFNGVTINKTMNFMKLIHL